MTLFLSAVIAGIAIGSIYGLVGIGYTVVFNATKIFNLAQGDLVMIGVMSSYYGLDVLKLPQWVVAVAVMAFVGLLSLVEERLVIRRFLVQGGNAFGWFIATLGLSAVIEAVVIVLFGNHPIVAIPSPFPSKGFHLGSVVVDYKDLFVFLVFLAVIAILEFFYKGTWVGQAMRATAQDREGASLLGINPVNMSRGAFLLAGVVAGIAGFAIAPLTFSDPTVGLNYTLKGFLALAIGGFGSIRGAVAGGLLLGIGEQLFDLYGSSNYEILTGLILVLLVLSIRPEGLFRSTAERVV